MHTEHTGWLPQSKQQGPTQTFIKSAVALGRDTKKKTAVWCQPCKKVMHTLQSAELCRWPGTFTRKDRAPAILAPIPLTPVIQMNNNYSTQNLNGNKMAGLLLDGFDDRLDGSMQNSKLHLLHLQSHRFSVWPPCCAVSTLECLMIWVSLKWQWVAPLDCSSHKALIITAHVRLLIMKACFKSQSSALLLCLAHEATVVTTCQVFVWNTETFWLYEVSCLGDWQSRTLYSNEMLVLFLTNCMCALTHSHVEASLPQEQAKLLTREQHIPTHTEHSLPQEQAKVVTTGQHIPLHTHTHTQTQSTVCPRNRPVCSQQSSSLLHSTFCWSPPRRKGCQQSWSVQLWPSPCPAPRWSAWCLPASPGPSPAPGASSAAPSPHEGQTQGQGWPLTSPSLPTCPAQQGGQLALFIWWQKNSVFSLIVVHT